MNLVTAFKEKDLRKKIFFTLFMLFIFRVGALIPVPGVDVSVVSNIVENNDLLSLYNMFVGGAFSSFTLFALGISPYITASIVIQLMTYDIIPYFTELSKSGEVGRKILNKYNKILALILALIQATGITIGVIISSLKDRQLSTFALVILTLVAGSMFLIWIGDKITEKGIGNGSSIIIFMGIITRIPGEIIDMVEGLKEGTVNPWILFGVLFVSFIVIIGVVFIQGGIRKVPVQYATKIIGRKTYGGQESHIPLKINQSGVMPVIFASSILALPQTIALLMNNTEAQNFVSKYLSATGDYFWIYLIFEVVLIVFFSYFYTTLSFNTEDIANNLKNSGGFIPGIRPGSPTQEYLSKISTKLTLAGAIFLSLIVIIPSVLSNYTSIYLTLTGTSILIVVGVALEVVRQLESNLVTRNYSSIFKK
jgi:preprotein translocase subunit SecY